jgi:nucleotide-binding universal stress UspA family protein
MGHNVLVPVDGSTQSWEALEHAIEHFESSTITVIHVIDHADRAIFVDTFGGFADPEHHERAQDAAEDLCEQARTRAENTGLDTEAAFECITKTGHPARAIVKYVESNDVDYVVMGSRGHTGLKRILLGSVAESVVRRSSVPVTVVR